MALEQHETLIKALAAGGLIVVGACAGVTAPALIGIALSQAAAGVVAGVGGDIISSIADQGFQARIDNRFKQQHELNHDLATALMRAFDESIIQLEQDWETMTNYRKLRGEERKQVQKSLDMLQRLREDSGTLFEEPSFLASLLAGDRLLQLRTTDTARLLSPAPDAPQTTTPLPHCKPQHDAQHAAIRNLDATLFAYLHSDEKLYEFVQQRMVGQWIERFVEILKGSDDVGTRAWRAYEMICQQNIMDAVVRSTIAVQAVQNDITQLRQWFDERIATLSLPPEQLSDHDRLGLDALLNELPRIVQWMDDISDLLRRVSEDVHAIRRDVQIIKDAVTAGQQTAMPIPTCPLPADTLFVGRDAFIAMLHASLLASHDDDTTTAAPLALTAVRGLPGVGKTTLLRVVGTHPTTLAHFRGGVLYAEVGPTPNVVTLLQTWLQAVGEPNPASDNPDELAGMVRSRLQQRNLPTLLIIDDVWDSSMPTAMVLQRCAAPQCRVLASSRSPDTARALADDDPLVLDVLLPEHALAMLRQHAPQVVRDDEQGAADLARAMGYLPLAIKLAGTLLTRERLRSTTPCATVQAQWHQRLYAVQGHEPRPGLPDNDKTSLQAIIALSYAALPDEQTRMIARALTVFGALPLDVDWDAIVAVLQQTTIALDEESLFEAIALLVGNGLLEFHDTRRRYHMHQTIYGFLVQAIPPDEHAQHDQIRMRHARHYADMMKRCDKEVEHRDTIDAALATLDREIGQMERGQAYAQTIAAYEATRTEGYTLLIAYGYACWSYFKLRARYTQREAWSQAALDAARRQQREYDESSMLNSLGNVYLSQGKYADAEAMYQKSLVIARRIGNIAGEASHLGNLGIVYRNQGKYAEAEAMYQQSLEIKRRIGDVAGEANTLGNLGIVYCNQGKYAEAEAMHQQSLEIARRIGDVAGEALWLGNLGLVYLSQGKYADAEAMYQQSLEIKRRIGDVAGEANTLGNLGIVYCNQGKYAEAEEMYQQSLVIQRRIGDVAVEANTLGNLGIVYRNQGKYAEAEAMYQQSLEIKRRIGDVAGEAQTLNSLGVLYFYQSKYEAAIEMYQQSLEIARRIGDVSQEAYLLNNFGELYTAQGKFTEAEAMLTQSLEIFQRLGGVAEESQVRYHLGTLYEKQGQLETALPYFVQAAEIAERIGMGQASEYRAKVGALGGGGSEP